MSNLWLGGISMDDSIFGYIKALLGPDVSYDVFDQTYCFTSIRRSQCLHSLVLVLLRDLWLPDRMRPGESLSATIKL